MNDEAQPDLAHIMAHSQRDFVDSSTLWSCMTKLKPAKEEH
jgi:hypothetical protein